MAQSEAHGVARSGVAVWLYRGLVVAAAAAMAYTWYQPWWIADVAVIKGTDDLVLHPWGVEVVRQVRVQADPSLYEMPAFFAPFTWVYFSAAMLALAASLFLNMRLRLGPIKMQLATALILIVGLSYIITVALAYGIGTLRAEAMEISFIGASEFVDPMSHRKMKMVSDLQVGYWYALYSGIALFALGLVRWLFNRKSSQ